MPELGDIREMRNTERGRRALTMRSLLRGAVSIAAVVSLTLGAAADDKKEWVADASRGQRLSESLCASCHLVGSGKTSGAIAGMPSFRTFSELPNKRILSALIMPHTPMPNIQLTRNEIADIIAYIDDLRRKAVGKPPANTKPREKPKYPSPS